MDSGSIELGWALTIQRAPRTAAYPSTIDVSGLPTSITDLDVTLSGLTHARSRDVDVMLVGPGGQQTTRFRRRGNDGIQRHPHPDGDVFSSLSSFTNNHRDLPAHESGRACRPVLLTRPASTGDTDLSVFDGTNPNGTWRLFVLDDDDSDSFTGNLDGWSLEIATPDPPPPVVPPPAADTSRRPARSSSTPGRRGPGRST